MKTEKVKWLLRFLKRLNSKDLFNLCKLCQRKALGFFGSDEFDDCINCIFCSEDNLLKTIEEFNMLLDD